MARHVTAQLTIDGLPAQRVARAVETHTLGQPAALEVVAVLPGFAEPDALLGKSATLVMALDGLSLDAVGLDGAGLDGVGLDLHPRVFEGIIVEATIVGSGQLGLGERGTQVELRVASRMALLDLAVDARIVQDLDVVAITREVLDRHGVGEVDVRLAGTYPARVYCVQYMESALAFVSRLWEEEGIWFFSEVGNDGAERLIVADQSSAAEPLVGNPVLPFRGKVGMGDTGDAVLSIAESRRVRPGKVTLRDYDFERPSLDLTSEAEATTRADLELYDWHGRYVEPAEGERLARVRLEEQQVPARELTIEARCLRLAAGRRVTLADAGEHDGAWFVTSVVHDWSERDGGADGAPRATARATLIPLDVPFRPAQRTPRPSIEGPQTATVVAPAGSPTETIHTDTHGRIKVKFHWDRSDVDDDRASCWMRVAQLQTSGSMVLPRIGWEVIVEFLEGDPDRPIVTGRLYDGVHRPPYALPEGKTRTALQTRSTPGGGGTNEIRFEDKAGGEEILVAAQHDATIVVANDLKRTVHNNETSSVKNNASLDVGGGQTTKITKGAKGSIGADQTVDVGGNRSLEVNAVYAQNIAGSSTTTVGGDQFEMDGNPLEALLALAAEAAAEFAQSLADGAIAAVQAQVDGAIAQVMAPITDLTDRAQAVGDAMQAAADGDVGALGTMAAEASGIPGAAEVAGAIAGGGGGDGGGGGEAGRAGGDGGGERQAGGEAGGEGGGAASPTAPLAALAGAAARQAIQAGAASAASAIGAALGLDAQGGGGSSGANNAGPEGDVEGVDATDRAKGPGHSTAVVGGSHEEIVGSNKVLAAVTSIDTNVGGSKTLDVGAALVQLAVGSVVEDVSGDKTETALGLVVLTKGGESEAVGGSRTTMVGGAILDLLKGDHVVEAGAPATFIGAFHKMEASGTITLKCGASEVVIDGSGITITSPMTTIMAGKIQLPKKVAEV